jgi:hypothetical protein
MGDDREYRGEGGLQALIATLGRRHIGLQEARIGLNLRRQQEGHVKDVGPLGKALANALFLGIGIRHGGSVQDSDVKVKRQGWSKLVQHSRLTSTSLLQGRHCNYRFCKHKSGLAAGRQPAIVEIT